MSLWSSPSLVVGGVAAPQEGDDGAVLSVHRAEATALSYLSVVTMSTIGRVAHLWLVGGRHNLLVGETHFDGSLLGVKRELKGRHWSELPKRRLDDAADDGLNVLVIPGTDRVLAIFQKCQLIVGEGENGRAVGE